MEKLRDINGLTYGKLDPKALFSTRIVNQVPFLASFEISPHRSNEEIEEIAVFQDDNVSRKRNCTGCNRLHNNQVDHNKVQLFNPKLPDICFSVTNRGAVERMKEDIKTKVFLKK